MDAICPIENKNIELIGNYQSDPWCTILKYMFKDNVTS
jgi:hypothetical protein